MSSTMTSPAFEQHPTSFSATPQVRFAGPLLLAVVLSVGAVLPVGCSRVKVPEAVLVENFQRPLDRDLTIQLDTALQKGAARWLDSNLIKPFLDDVRISAFSAHGVEVRPGQFPDRPELLRCVNDCARILGMKPPRVFVSGTLERPAAVFGIADPVVVISASILGLLTDERELRFIIGRQFGHIRVDHARWQFLVYGTVAAARKSGLIPDDLVLAPVLPLLKWSREAEMTADNAGLICAQSLPAAEQALLKIETSTRETLDADVFLTQSAQQSVSKFSETLLFWRELTGPQPFLADRLKQLRQYAKSVHYTHLW
jgi:hypothetical protein